MLGGREGEIRVNGNKGCWGLGGGGCREREIRVNGNKGCWGVEKGR